MKILQPGVAGVGERNKLSEKKKLFWSGNQYSKQTECFFYLFYLTSIGVKFGCDNGQNISIN